MDRNHQVVCWFNKSS